MLPLESKRVKILETEELFFSYDKRGDYVLREINLSFFQSTVYGIFGPNGSGKSTLIKLLAGILKPVKGNIRLNNKYLNSRKKKEIAKEIGYLPQENPISSEISVYYFLLLSRYSYLGFLKEFDREDFNSVESVIEKFKLNGIKERPINKLSGGERRKVMLASLFVVSPEIFLLDEPDSFLDPANRKEIEEILNLLRKENKTLIFTSHSLELITSLSDRIIGLKDGKIVYQGKNLLEKNNEIFSEIFNIKYQVLREGKRLFFVYE